MKWFGHIPLSDKPHPYWLRSLFVLWFLLLGFNAWYLPPIGDSIGATAFFQEMEDPSALFTDYSDPKRHPLFDVLAYLPFQVNHHPLSRRVISLLVALCVPILLLQVFRLYLTDRQVLFALAICLFSFPFLFYTVVGRGYMMQVVLFLIAWLSLRKLLNKDIAWHWKWAVSYVLSVALAYYTLPSFLYIHLFLAVYSIYYYRQIRPQRRLQWIGVNILGGGLAGLLYLPMLVGGGLEKIRSISYFQPAQSLEEMWYKLSFIGFAFPASLYEVGTLGLLLALLFVAVGMWQAYRGRNRQLLFLVGALVVSALMLMLGQRLVPFARNLTYAWVPLSMVMAVGFAATLRAAGWTVGVVACSLLLFYGMAEKKEYQCSWAFGLAEILASLPEGAIVCPCDPASTCDGMTLHLKIVAEPAIQVRVAPDASGCEYTISPKYVGIPDNEELILETPLHLLSKRVDARP